MKFREAIERLRIIAETLPDDDPDKLELLNTEADYTELMEWALVKRNEYLSKADGNKELSSLYAERRKSFENRAEGMKEVIGLIIREAGEKKYQGIAGTVSIGQKPQGLTIIDESKIPDCFFKTEPVLMKAELNKAFKDGQDIPGTAPDNGGEILTIRSK